MEAMNKWVGILIGKTLPKLQGMINNKFRHIPNKEIKTEELIQEGFIQLVNSIKKGNYRGRGSLSHPFLARV